MNLTLKRKITSILALGILMSIEPLTAQITIGTAIEPSKGALLDLKTQFPDENNITSKTGGLLLPRVKLLNMNTLEPFIATNDSDLVELKKVHVGLTVYNLSTNVPFTTGLYVWSGEKWLKMDDGQNKQIIGATNGLSVTSNNENIKLGGELTHQTSITQNDKNIDFATGTSGEWRVNSNDLVVFGDNSIGVGNASHPENTRFIVGGNTNTDGKLIATGNTDLKGKTTTDGTFRYNFNNGSYADQFLQASDNDGTAKWVVPEIGESVVLSGTAIGSGNTRYSFNSSDQYSSAQYILLPPGKWLVKFTFLMRRTNTTSNHTKCWVTLGLTRRTNFSSGNTHEPYNRYVDRNNPSAPVHVECVLDSQFGYTAVSGDIIVDNYATPGADYPSNGFNNTTNKLSRFDLVVIKGGEGLRPNNNNSWNWTSGNLQLNNNATENMIVALKLD